MTEGELKASLWAKINNSIAYQGGRLANARMQALRYYNGDKFGNEVPGRSQVVSRDVAEAIDSVMPSLLRIFTSSDDAVRFDPREANDEKQADQISDYINWIWSTQNDGFQNYYVWFKAALMDRAGIIKVWWDEQETSTTETYKGLTEAQLSMLVMSDDVEIQKIESYPDPDALDTQDDFTVLGTIAGAELAADHDGPSPALDELIKSVQNLEPPKLYDVEAVKTNKKGQCKIAPVPGDEFLIDRRAVSLDETPFCAHRFKTTITDLVELFPDEEDTIRTLPTGEEGEYTQERLERFKEEDQLPWREDNPADPSMREVWVTEAYIRIDFNGDGLAEWRKITVAGDLGYTILDNIEIDDHPFAAVTPIPMPFKFYGMSIADQTQDIQLIKSTLLRGILDNMYNAISPQLGVVEGQVNYDDLLTRRPGGVIRMKGQGAIQELPNLMLGQEPYGLVEYFDGVREQRTGVTRYNQGLDAESLNKTATGIQMIKNAGAERVELIARVFAETGVKRAFRRILELVCKHQRKPQVIRLKGKYVEIDPREWSTEYDVVVNVGLGTGSREAQALVMQQALQFDQLIIQMQGGLHGPIVTAENLYNKLSHFLQYAGIKSVDQFYTDPTSAPPMPPPMPKPEPSVQVAQINAQAEGQRAAQQLQAETQHLQMKEAASDGRHQRELDLKRELAYAEMALKHQLEGAKINIDAAKVGNEADLKSRELVHKQTVDKATVLQPTDIASLADQVKQQSDLLGNMIAKMHKPRKIIRDANDRPVGVALADDEAVPAGAA